MTNQEDELVDDEATTETELICTLWVSPDGKTSIAVMMPEEFSEKHAAVSAKRLADMCNGKFVDSMMETIRTGTEHDPSKLEVSQILIQGLIENLREQSDDEPNEDVVPVLEDLV